MFIKIEFQTNVLYNLSGVIRVKIENYKKLKNGKYRLSFNNSETMDVYEDVILNLELLLKKDISESLKQKILQENEKYDTYAVGLKYLNTRVRSKKEIWDYLKKKEYSFSNIENAINILEKQGYINDLNFAKAFLNNRLITTSNGPYKIKSDLKEKGVSNEVIDEVMEEYTLDIQKEKILKQMNRMIKSNRNKGNYLLKRKIFNELSKQGFKRGLLNEYLQNLQLDSDQELRDKEYQKLYQRLSKKYQGSELEYKIKEKLYQKGFESS